MMKSIQQPEVRTEGCDREPIHIPGSIQPHGFLLALKETDFSIVQLSENVEKFCDFTPQKLLTMGIQSLLDQNQLEFLKNQMAHSELKALNPFAVVIEKQGVPSVFDATLHRSEELLLLELEPSANRDNRYANTFHQQAISAIQRLEHTQNITELFQIVTGEVKRLTGFDRVMVYQFSSEGHGEVIAETKETHLESFLGLHYPASDIPAQARALYLRNWLRLIPDVEYKPAALSPPYHPLTGKPLDLSFSALRSVSPIHVQYLKNMGVQASMSISLIKDNALWGLIACHHGTPKFVPYELRTACEFLGQILSWQLGNKLLQNKNEELLLQKNRMSHLVKAIMGEKNWLTALLKQEKDLLALAHAEGAVIIDNNAYYLLGKTPSLENVKALSLHVDRYFKEGDFFTDCLTHLYPEADTIKETASGLLALTLSQEKNSAILWFKPEMTQTVHWAGDPRKNLAPNDLTEQLTPRKSFATWKEQVRLKSAPWRPVDQQITQEFKEFLLEAIVTHRLKNEAVEAIEQKKRQEEFIDTICHEIRNPINGIVGSLTLMKDHLEKMVHLIESSKETTGAEGKPKLTEHLSELSKHIATINECAEHQTLITNEVLDFSKLDWGKVRLENKPFILNQIIESVIKMFSGKIAEKGLALKVISSDPSMALKGDPQRLKQILINLLSNAIKFTTQGFIAVSLVELSSAPTHKTMQITVEDTGRGMTDAEQGRLFKPYSQANEQIAGQYGGSGLGLAISSKFVQLMGSNIEVSSQKDLGTRFSFTIEFEPATEEEKKKLATKATLPSPSMSPLFAPVRLNKKILVVEDNIINQKLLNAYLQKGNYECQIAANGREAVEKFLTFSFDAILMDIEMPIMDGYAATQLIRQKEQELHLKPIPIICLTGNAREEYREQALNAGMNDFITKPLHREALLTKLAQLLSSPAPPLALEPVNPPSLLRK